MNEASADPSLHLLTLAVADLAASLAFYGDRLGYRMIASGQLSPAPALLPAATGAYAILRPPEGAGGVALRLLETTGGHRPPPAEGPRLPPSGLAGLTLSTGDDGAAYMALKGAGAPTLSWPQFYALPAIGGLPRREFKTFTIVGPDGERVFVHRQLSSGGVMTPWTEAAAYAHGGAVLATRDRWPMVAFYAALTGAVADKGAHIEQDPMNIALGAPVGAYFHFGRLARSLYWREYRSEPPQPASPAEDRPGPIMISLAVDDLDRARQAGEASGATSLGSGALPDEDGRLEEGLYWRGPDGELVEIVGRAKS